MEARISLLGAPRSPEGSHEGFVARAATLRIASAAPIELADITPQLEAFVAATGIVVGWINVQVRHTTAGIAVNENERLLLSDLAVLLERLAPRAAAYAHDALHLRPDAPADERANGHAHAKALLLRSAECLNVAGGRLQLGRWQRVLLVELDGPRERELSLVALGEAAR
jgi:secondary thiamine-phosphate synthase enzyme